MKIKITTASPDALNHDTLILGFFSDERPPRGYCGLVDWRLNGIISTEIARERFRDSFPKNCSTHTRGAFESPAFSSSAWGLLPN